MEEDASLFSDQKVEISSEVSEAIRKIHEKELQAYIFVLRALRSQSVAPTWNQVLLLQTLKSILHVPDDIALRELQRATMDPSLAKIAQLNQSLPHPGLTRPNLAIVHDKQNHFHFVDVIEPNEEEEEEEFDPSVLHQPVVPQPKSKQKMKAPRTRGSTAPAKYNPPQSRDIPTLEKIQSMPDLRVDKYTLPSLNIIKNVPKERLDTLKIICLAHITQIEREFGEAGIELDDTDIRQLMETQQLERECVDFLGLESGWEDRGADERASSISSNIENDDAQNDSSNDPFPSNDADNDDDPFSDIAPPSLPFASSPQKQDASNSASLSSSHEQLPEQPDSTLTESNHPPLEDNSSKEEPDSSLQLSDTTTPSSSSLFQMPSFLNTSSEPETKDHFDESSSHDTLFEDEKINITKRQIYIKLNVRSIESSDPKIIAIRDTPPEGITASPVSEENLFVWDAILVGPSETPWEGGLFPLRLQFPDNYPEKPPSIRFQCEMFHPNVFQNGQICLDVIQKLWTPIFTVSSILISIQSLLTDPNPSSPANVTAAHLYQTDRKEYNKRVRRCAQKTLDA
ncbi:putative ubiquitin-conjugating enzyme 1, E2-like protein [Monocercomonoides exilis]|uniref:putative ubiquitin-conjugating enzyme 1, E2-like protein n=1 Tax=Monocercomonoides exilis TaxID=2049356 RepID=UPI00355A2D8C|nr:putative ubiquitin-conjugating enzyme 1, E2-like protein [Monocercomonoides exilis]|eukprot:MONOS_2490.1-p1 / transcript=MONOS_2490.1 / gene=MONOS_2490 / organism=Monocercomonoides_exilis_PA203 / gene_product=ubiquitin-conjugating enzyme 1, E2-like protein / transcript_product=ubiquitin-conjugating enzyme 1, E2-like protein / location=Mono_scaffold00051:165091-167570(+) / protein_length=569 / sequence_SO=supercontig / SO=protein_coding / is_pseudo=false